MRACLLIVLFLMTFKVSAASYITRIEMIDFPDKITESTLVFLTNGKVAKIGDGFLDVLEIIQEAKDYKFWVSITLNEEREITSIELTEAPGVPSTQKFLSSPPEIQEYFPSVLKSIEWANKYFLESRRKDKSSQCYNRAHIWSYEWFKKHKFYSSKMFIFFTRKFIREQNFEWWFHVAPYVHVAIGSKIKERIMDMKYTSGPITLGNWIKRFVNLENPACLTVSKYSDYANYPENGNCYIMRTSMYYYWPLDIENEELHGTMKSNWTEEEIKTAYLEAFDIVK